MAGTSLADLKTLSQSVFLSKSIGKLTKQSLNLPFIVQQLLNMLAAILYQNVFQNVLTQILGRGLL